MKKTSAQKFLGSDDEEYLDYCKDMEMDPEDEGSWEIWKEVREEMGDRAWDNMSEEDREGWTDNMNKDD